MSTQQLPFITTPAFVLSNSKLDFFDKYLFSYFWGFFVSGQNITVSNNYLANLFQVSIQHVQSRIKKIEDLGYIKRLSVNNRRQVIITYSDNNPVNMEDDCSNNGDNSPPTTVGEGDQPQLVGGPTTVGAYNKDYNKANKKEKNINTKKEKVAPPYQETYYPIAESSPTPLTDEFEKVMHRAEYADDSFEVFWETYPLKKDKRTAKALWMQQGCWANAASIISKLFEQVNNDVKFLTGYIPTPANYLRGHRWEDEIERQKSKKTNPALNNNDTSWFFEKGIFS